MIDITFFIESYGIILIILVFGLLILMDLFSYPPFSNILIENLENDYIKYNYHNTVKYIHILGSGHIVDSQQPISSLLTNASTKRVIEGVIIYKHMKNVKLVFIGYAHKTIISNAKMNAKLAIALGVNKNDIILGEIPKDTLEEAIFIKDIVKKDKFILVTSATHMSRALSIFKSINLNPIPAPTDYYKNKISTYLQLATVSALKKTQIAIHEYIGILWYKLKGILAK